jgi:arylsulfatase A-like enzyme
LGLNEGGRRQKEASVNRITVDFSSQVSAPRRVSAFALALALTVPLSSPSAKVASAEAPPNFLVIVTDDQREGLEVMPKMLRWLREGGTTYANAFSTTPLCCPSRASIFTGRYAHNHGVTTNHNPEKLNHQTTVQYHLRRAGYRTGIFGKFLNSWPLPQNPPFFDRWATFGWSDNHYLGGNWNVQGTIRTVSDYATHFIGDQTKAFLASPSSKPWFLYLAPPNPHSPFTAEEKYASAAVPSWTCNPAVMESDRSDKPPFVQAINRGCGWGQRTRTQQLRTLFSVDDMVERVLATLKANGDLNNTLVFFLSDNGFLWSEHGLGGKRYPYLQSIRVPMFARWTGHLPAGAVDTRLVANIDVAPTILDAAGLSPASMDGHSLLSGYSRQRILTENWRAPEVPDLPTWASLLTKQGHYVAYYDTSGAVTFREYYDLTVDPWELSNRFAPPAGWTNQLSADRRCAGSSCP